MPASESSNIKVDRFILQKVGKDLLEFTGDDVNDFEGREYLEILLEEEENEKKKIK